MPVSFRWYDEDSIFVVACKGEIAQEDVRRLVRVFCARLDASIHPLQLIFDWRQASGNPLTFSNVFETFPMLRHKNMGMVAVVGMNSNLSFWADYLTKLSGLRYAAFDTPEAAADFLRRQNRIQAQVNS